MGKMEAATGEKGEVLLRENTDGLQCTDRISKCKDAVCFIFAQDDKDQRRGSGFFAKLKINGIEVKCIATNNHVLPSKEAARDGEAIFFYEGSNPGISIKLDPDQLFYTDEYLDYSFIGCDAYAIENAYGITPLEFLDTYGSINDDIFIFQHPKGESKQVSYHKISNIDPPFLFYTADTDIGSSGSPVLRKFQLIAIHSKGSEQRRYNKGTLCSEILRHVNHVGGTSPPCMLENNRISRKREALQDISEASPPKKTSLSNQFSKDPDKQPSEKELNDLSKDIITNWKSLGRELGVKHKDIMKIHKDNINYDDLDEKAFAMLMKWKEEKGDMAIFRILSKALTNIGLVSTAQKHC